MRALDRLSVNLIVCCLKKVPKFFIEYAMIDSTRYLKTMAHNRFTIITVAVLPILLSLLVPVASQLCDDDPLANNGVKITSQ